MKRYRFLFFLFTVNLCIASVFAVFGIYQAQQAGYGSALEAYKLQDKPEQYFVLDNPDQYAIKALSTPSTLVFVDLDKTLIGNIILSKGTNNVLFDDYYYEINVLSVDPSCFDYIVPLIIIWIVWGIVAIVIVSVRYGTKNKR